MRRAEACRCRRQGADPRGDDDHVELTLRRHFGEQGCVAVDDPAGGPRIAHVGQLEEAGLPAVRRGQAHGLLVVAFDHHHVRALRANRLAARRGRAGG